MQLIAVTWKGTDGKFRTTAGIDTGKGSGALFIIGELCGDEIVQERGISHDQVISKIELPWPTAEPFVWADQAASVSALDKLGR